MNKKEIRQRPDAGIAIGMILFVVALVAVISIAMTSSGNFTTSTITPDRVSALVKSQGQLIRSKILECYTNGYERGELADKYPSSTGTGTLVSALDCPSYSAGLTSLWTGQVPTSFPPPPPNFGAWYYVNAGKTGGRCIRIQPDTPGDVGVKTGLAQAAGAFSSTEVVYDSASSSQRFIIWITPATGSVSADCSS